MWGSYYGRVTVFRTDIYSLTPAPSGSGAIRLGARDAFEDLLLYVGGRLRIAFSNEQLGEVVPAHNGVRVPFSHSLVM